MNDLNVFGRRPELGSVVAAATPLQPEPASGEFVNIKALILAFRRNLWRFMAVVAVVLAATVAFIASSTPNYVATARVAINNRAVHVAPQLVSGADNMPVVSSLPDDSSTIDTEVAVIASRHVARRVVLALHLDADPEFSLAMARAHAGPLARIKRTIGAIITGGKSSAQTAPSVTPMDYAINTLLGRIKAVRYNLTDAIDISFSDPNPRKAATIANAIAEAYLVEQIASKEETVLQVNAFLDTQLTQMRAQYMADSVKLQNYRIAHNLLSAGATTLTEQEVSNSNQSEVAAKAEVAADQANLDTARDQLARGSTGEDVGGALSSAVIQSLRSQRATISARVADLQSHYGDKYPELLRARQQLSDVDLQIQAEINRVISNLEAKTEISRRRLESIEESLASTKAVLEDNSKAQVSLDQLQQNTEASRVVYQSYLDRLKETAALAGGERSDARILSAAPTPTSPATPRVLLDLLLGLVVGVGCGVAVVVVTEMTNGTIATTEDVERRLGQRYLGGVPLLSSVPRREGASPLAKGPRGPSSGHAKAAQTPRDLLGLGRRYLGRVPWLSWVARRQKRPPLEEVVAAPNAAYAESIRHVRASIRDAAPGDQPLVVGITSPLPKEGKTLMAISLARSAALQGVKTVLVDCDLRRRGVNQLVAHRGEAPGLIEVLSGRASLDDGLVIDSLSGAALLPCYMTETPAEDLLGGAAMDYLIGELRKRFEFIVLDAPPLLPVADGREIAGKSDLVVLTIRWRKTELSAIQLALRLLPQRATMAGVVMNQIDMQKQANYGFGDPGFYYKEYREYFA